MIMTENCVHDVKVTSILWIKPLDKWVNLNSDGSCLSDGRIGVGGVIRNNEGDLLLAFFTPLGHGSNNQAQIEVVFFFFGIAWCVQMGFHKVILEVESELLHKWINRQISPPWYIDQALSKLHAYNSQLHGF